MTQHDKIIYNAGQYSFCVESILFPQLTKEQQKVWVKELERAYIAGAEWQKEQIMSNLEKYIDESIKEWDSGGSTYLPWLKEKIMRKIQKGE